MASNRFQSNFRFAIHKESSDLRTNTPPNQIERIGNWFSWFVYEFKSILHTTLTDPRFITVFLTLFVMTLTALLFYPSTTWNILEDTGRWIIDHINWSYVRFTLWLVSELTILGLGLRAFGRFSNRKLMAHYEITF